MILVRIPCPSFSSAAPVGYFPVRNPSNRICSTRFRTSTSCNQAYTSIPVLPNNFSGHSDDHLAPWTHKTRMAPTFRRLPRGSFFPLISRLFQKDRNFYSRCGFRLQGIPHQSDTWITPSSRKFFRTSSHTSPLNSLPNFGDPP